MALNVRRVVAGHNASGKSAVETDELVPAASRGIAGITGCEMWSTDQMPVDNSAAAEASPVARALTAHRGLASRIHRKALAYQPFPHSYVLPGWE
jgi:hypothetical protein